jgi:hypothetical protein
LLEILQGDDPVFPSKVLVTWQKVFLGVNFIKVIQAKEREKLGFMISILELSKIHS